MYGSGFLLYSIVLLFCNKACCDVSCLEKSPLRSFQRPGNYWLADVAHLPLAIFVPRCARKRKHPLLDIELENNRNGASDLILNVSICCYRRE